MQKKPNERINFVGEKMFRKDIFEMNVEKVRRGQLLFNSGQRSYNQKINCFGDLTFSEYGSKYTGLESWQEILLLLMELKLKLKGL